MTSAKPYSQAWFADALDAYGGRASDLYDAMREYQGFMANEVEWFNPNGRWRQRTNAKVAMARERLAASAPKYPDDADIVLAIEEAAHEVIGVVAGLLPESVTIVATSEFAGLAKFEAGCTDAGELRMVLSGPIANRIARGLDPTFIADRLEWGDSQVSAPDIKRARELTNKIDGTDLRWPEDRKTFRDAEADAIRLVKANWETIRKVAHALHDQKTLTGSEVAKLMGRPDVSNKILKKRIEKLQADHESDLLHARAAELRKKFGGN